MASAAATEHQPASEAGRPRKDRTSMCPYCGMTFNKKEHLQRHERTHTLDRPYHCDFAGCGKAFARRDTLTRHTRLHQRVDLPGVSRSGAADHLEDDEEAGFGSTLTTPMGSKQVSPDEEEPSNAGVPAPAASLSATTKGKKSAVHSRTSSAGSAQRGSRRGSNGKKAAAKNEEAPNAGPRNSRPRRSAAIAAASYDESAIMDTDSPSSDGDMDEDAADRMDTDAVAMADVPAVKRESIDASISATSVPVLSHPIHNFAAWDQAHQGTLAPSQREKPSPSQQPNAALMMQHAGNGNPYLLGYSSSANSSGSSSGASYNSSQLGSQASPYSFSASPAGHSTALGLDLGLPASDTAVPILPTPDGSHHFQGFNFALPSSAAGSADDPRQDYRHLQQSYTKSQDTTNNNNFNNISNGMADNAFPVFQSPPSVPIDIRPTTTATAITMASLSAAPVSIAGTTTGAAAAVSSQRLPYQHHHQQQHSEPGGVFFNPFAYHHFQHPYSPDTHAATQQQLPSLASQQNNNNNYRHGRSASDATASRTSASSTFSSGSQGYPNKPSPTLGQSFLARGTCRSPDSTQLSQCGSALRTIAELPSVATLAPASSTVAPRPDSAGAAEGEAMHLDKLGRAAIPHFDTTYFNQVATHFQQQQQQQQPQMQQRLQQLPLHSFLHEQMQRQQQALQQSYPPVEEFEIVSPRSTEGSPYLSTSPTLAAAPIMPYSNGSPASDNGTLPSLSSSFSSAFSGDFLQRTSAPSAATTIIPVKSETNLAAAFKYKNSCMQPLTIVDPSAAALRGSPGVMNAMLGDADVHTDQFINWPESQPSPLSFSGLSPDHTYSASSVNTADSPSTASYLDFSEYDVSTGSLFGEKTFTAMTIPHELPAATTARTDEYRGKQSPIASLEDWLNQQVSGQDAMFL